MTGLTSANVNSGGATIDTQNFSITIAQNLLNGGGGGGLTKQGGGTLTLSGSNAYTGATTISSGTLEVKGSLASASPINVGSNHLLYTVNGATIGNNITGDGTLTLNTVSGAAGQRQK